MLFDRVLFVGAHADDIELFAGGWLAQRSRLKLPTWTLTFSVHRGITDHAKAFAEHTSNMNSKLELTGMAVHNLEACSSGKQGFLASRGLIYDLIVDCVKQFKPTVVVTHAPTDTNQDHQQVCEEVNRSCKGITSILYGHYPFNDLGGFTAQMYVPLTKEDVDMKNALINGYVSQYAEHRKYFDPRVWEGLACAHGAVIGEDYAEVYQVGRLVAR